MIKWLKSEKAIELGAVEAWPDGRYVVYYDKAGNTIGEHQYGAHSDACSVVRTFHRLYKEVKR